jgi:hypothetical protein
MKRLLLIFALSVSAASAADLPSKWNFAGVYPQVRGNNIVKIYLTAAGGAYGAANTDLAIHKEKMLFCQPRTLTLTVDNYVNIFEQELEKELEAVKQSEKTKEGKQDWLTDTPIEFVLLWGLEATFPCP